ncbi:MAG: hypothetical protein JNK99_15695 [Candidatus Accumulibacter sp.]|uniref:hypothetical protein n=1 Tax=Accumulibacter sp. TaxID=2053492 RepID=UPI001A3E494A|nr:hypothetical protein [Accumulibacter sp.]MBL8396163.1 hypothetical protein [Accumulibacter sp.]
MTTPTFSIEVVVSHDEELAALMRLATQHADAKDWDAALATLYEAKARMIESLGHQTNEAWCKLPLYLSRAGRFAEAMAEFDWLLADAPRRARKESYLDDPSVSYGKGTTKQSMYRLNLRNIKRVVAQSRAVALRRQQKAEAKLPSNQRGPTASLQGKAEGASDHRTGLRNMKAVTADEVTEPLFKFMQMAFAGASDQPHPLERQHAETIILRIASGSPLPIKEAISLPGGERRALKELLCQYVMFLTMFRDLAFPADFLSGTDETKLGSELLAYVARHQWPFPQQLPWSANA